MADDELILRQLVEYYRARAAEYDEPYMVRKALASEHAGGEGDFD